MKPEEREAFARARAIVDLHAELTGQDFGTVTGILQDLATYQRKVGVASLALLAESAMIVDKRRAGLS